MKLRKIVLMTLGLTTCFLSCNKDDEAPPIVIEIRDRAEQQVADKDSLLDYLATHYYNSSEFDAIAYPTIADLKITELVAGTNVPSDATLLKDATNLETKEVVYAETDYEYYILRLKQGNGTKSPMFADNVVVKYEGFTLSDAIFDSAVSPTSFDLVGVVSGWRKVIPQFNVAESFVENGDGTITFVDQGIGVMFLPSGLGYFSQAPAGIPAYSPLVFKFELLQKSQNDHDNDGIPSYLEDLNGNGELVTSNLWADDDTDENLIDNFLDADDDGDGVLTINELERKTYIVNTNEGEQEPVLNEEIEFEIERSNNAGVITIKTLKIVDSNNNDIDDHLDKDVTINYNE